VTGSTAGIGVAIDVPPVFSSKLSESFPAL
jgi:hypothetical protein